MHGSTRKRWWLAAALGAALAGACVGSAPADPTPRLDVVISGGTVFDGSGAAGRVADVGIKDDRIYRIGDLSRVPAGTRYDATGLYVTPGFIDLHAHTDTGAPLAAAKSALTQGVTTEAIGPDGFGTFEIADQLEQLGSIDTGINVAPYVGFNTVWQDTMGESDPNPRPTEAQFDRMRGRIDKGMREGAWSVSGGLGYTPAAFARTDEVIEVVKAAKPWRAMFSDHIRDETNGVIDAVNEDINIGRFAGVATDITHIKVAGPRNWGKSVTMLRLLADDRAAGGQAGGCVYPYTAASTGLSFYVPAYAKDGGTAAMLARFADPQLRPRIADEITAFVTDDVGTPDNVDFPSLGNKSIADFMAQYGGVSIGEAVIRILEENNGSITAVMHIGSEEDLARFIQDPFIAYCSDGGVTDSTRTHPRRYGSYPRVLGRYVREQGLVSWAEAIRKMSGLPATRLGMVDRGFLAEGMAADVTVFDPATIIDRATFDNPQQYSEGVRWVFVNGKLALDAGEPTNVHSGLALRRASSMPTRPQNVDAPPPARASGSVAPIDGSHAIRLKADLSQRGTSARGTVAVDGPGRIELRSVRLGKLQTTRDWFSVTGIGRAGDGREHAFLLTVDEHDPLADADETRVTIRIDGVGETYGVLRTGRHGGHGGGRADAARVHAR